MIKPSWSFADVFALNALQKSMMLTPCWPSAGPTGGAGLAWPAGICSLMILMTFLAIGYLLVVRAPVVAGSHFPDLKWSFGLVRFAPPLSGRAHDSKLFRR